MMMFVVVVVDSSVNKEDDDEEEEEPLYTNSSSFFPLRPVPWLSGFHARCSGRRKCDITEFIKIIVLNDDEGAVGGFCELQFYPTLGIFKSIILLLFLFIINHFIYARITYELIN